MSLLQGSTFINRRYGGLTPHLWIVLSDPEFDSSQIVIVNITTWRDSAVLLNDTSCIVQAGEHSFVTAKSYVYYREAIITSQGSIEAGFAGGVLTPSNDCTPELLEKVLLGALQSPHIPIKIIGVLRRQGLIE